MSRPQTTMGSCVPTTACLQFSVPPNIAPLDVSNLPDDWPKWRQSFQIFISAAQISDDRQKLALFMNLLGQDGRGILSSLLPQLLDFESPAGRSVSFSAAWQEFESHCRCEGTGVTRERIIFHSLKRGHEESLPEFHCRLAEQAKKCGFDQRDSKMSFKQQSIRDRLMVNMQEDPEFQEEVLATTDNPTVEEYYRFQRNLGWGKIISYLNLAELVNLTESAPRFDGLVESWLQKGTSVSINSDFLTRYPVAENEHLYRKYAPQVTSVVFDQIEPEDLPKLFSIFKNISKVTLTRLKFFVREEDEVHFPSSLTHLTLIDCLVNRFIEKWLRILSSSLESLHVERHIFTVFFIELRENIVFEALKSLTIINELDCNPFQSPVLQEFSLNLAEDSKLYWHRLSSIRSLAIGHYWTKRDFRACQELKNLRHLRVLQKVDPKYKEAIDSLQLETVYVHYFDIPTADSCPFSTLNEYCVRHILDLLPTEDLVSLYDTNTTLRRLIREKRNIKFKLWLGIAREKPFEEHPRFWFVIGQIVSALNIEYDVPAYVLGLCVKLKALEWFNYGRGLNDSFEEVFQRLDTTLIDIRIADLNGAVLLCLRHLHNIRHFSCYSIHPRIMEPNLQFFDQIKDHLQSLHLGEPCRFIDSEFVRVIRGMKQLKSIKLESKEMIQAILNDNCFPELEKLYLPRYPYFREPIENLEVPKLVELQVIDPSLLKAVLERPVPMLRLINVVDLSEDMLDFLVREAQQFESFKNGDFKLLAMIDVESLVLPLVKSLPMLAGLGQFSQRISDDGIMELRSYLRETKHTLSLLGWAWNMGMYITSINW